MSQVSLSQPLMSAVELVADAPRRRGRLTTGMTTSFCDHQVVQLDEHRRALDRVELVLGAAL